MTEHEFDKRALDHGMGEDPDLFLAGSQEALDRMTPTISVDRALGHVLDDIQVDLDELRSFYYELPHEEKMDLDQLRIHFSAARPVNNRFGSIVSGRYMGYGLSEAKRDTKKTVPELEDTTQPTIIVYVGSAFIEKEDGVNYRFTDMEEFGETLNVLISQTINHELTHFAQDEAGDHRETPNSIEKARNRVAYFAATSLLRLFQNKQDVVLGFGAAGAAELATSGGTGSLVVGVGTAALSHRLNKGRRAIEKDRESHEEYRSQDYEEDARSHQYADTEVATIALVGEIDLPKGHGIDSFIKPSDEKVVRMWANVQHKGLSLTPRGMSPNEVRKAARKSEVAAILRKRQINKATQ